VYYADRRVYVGSDFPVPIFHHIRNKRLDDCRTLCRGRKNLALLRANRQIHEEASSVFWQKNTFCFDNLQQYTDTINGLTTAALSSIRHICLLEPLRFNGDLTEEEFHTLRDDVFQSTCRLTALQTLETSPSLVDCFRSRCERRSLRVQITSVEIRCFSQRGFDGNEWIFARAARREIMPEAEPKIGVHEADCDCWRCHVGTSTTL
jgi:hypothetical protein